jgi:hypothetical protein
LLAHALDLAYFADCFLELLHSRESVLVGDQVGKKGEEHEHIPRTVILNVVFLNLLDVVVSLRVVHSFGTREVSAFPFEVKIRVVLTISMQSLVVDTVAVTLRT